MFFQGVTAFKDFLYHEELSAYVEAMHIFEIQEVDNGECHA
jgi:sulfite reductase alpha subunit-like flavoprotein